MSGIGGFCEEMRGFGEDSSGKLEGNEMGCRVE